MKFIVNRDALYEGLQKIQSVVEKKTTVQILSHLHLKTQKDTLEISATDLEVGMRISLPVAQSEEGKITVSAKNFLDIVKELPSQDLQFHLKEPTWIELRSGKSKFTIVALSADEFPNLPDFESKNYVSTKRDSFMDMMDRTSFAVSMDATRYLLNGVYLEALESSQMRMVATDATRLSYVDQELFLQPVENFRKGILIPRKGLTELRKLVETSSELGLAFEKGNLFVQTDQAYLFIRLIEGDYPDYRSVIPKDGNKKIEISKEEFISALKRVSLLAHEKSKAIKFSIRPHQMVLSSSNPDLGEANEELDIQYHGEELEIGFNARYLLDCLQVLKGERIEITLKDRLSPGLLQGAEEKHHHYVIMPMRI